MEQPTSASGQQSGGKKVSNQRYQTHRPCRQYFYFCAVSDLLHSQSLDKMAISDMLNRRVRARPDDDDDDDDDVYPEVSDGDEDGSQDEGEENGDSDAEELQPQVRQSRYYNQDLRLRFIFVTVRKLGRHVR